MELPVTGAELWRCFNIHVSSCNEQVESNVSVSQRRHNPTCDKHPNGRTQTNMKRRVCYVWAPDAASTGTQGRQVCGWRDTITRGGGEWSKTREKVHIISILKFTSRCCTDMVCALCCLPVKIQELLSSSDKLRSQAPQTILLYSLYLSIMSLIELQKQMGLD